MREARLERGGWRVRAADPASAAAALELAREARGSGPRELGGSSVWLELRALDGFGRLAARLGRGALALQAARLDWLRARAFLAPKVLAHGLCLRGAIPRAEFLLTELTPAELALSEFLERRADDLRAEVLDELACELARMQALHFHPSAVCAASVRVERAGTRGRLWFLERSRGALRGSALGLEARLGLDARERERFARLFAAELAAQRPPR